MISLTALLKESTNIKTAKEIADYIKFITPDESDIPDYYIDLVLKSNKLFKLQTIQIKDLLQADENLRDYVESGEDRYADRDSDNEYVPYPEELDNPIVVFNGEVIDGYSRTAKHVALGDPTIQAYVSI